MLAGIVEQAGMLAEGLLDDFFEALALEAAVLEQVIAVGDVGLVMLVVVVLERFLAHVRTEGIIGIGQGRKFESHSESPIETVGLGPLGWKGI